MKIPKSLKLPRKLKKEVKKGITRRMCKSSFIKSKQSETSVLGFFNYSYSGSNTKAFFRLCKYVNKLERLLLKGIRLQQIE